MTLVVCIKCGSVKHGAFNPCNECGLRPETETEVAYSLAFSDHHWPVDALNAMSRNVRQGGSLPSLPKEQEQQFLAALKGQMQQFGSILGLPSGGKHPKFIFDHARLAIDPRQPAPYPTPDHLREFSALGDASANSTEGNGAARRVNLAFQTPDETEYVLKNVDWEWAKRAWAVTRLTPLGTITCHLNFSMPSVGSMQGRAIHEMVHIYRARGLFHQSEWERLVGLTRQLGVMQLSISDFLRATNCAEASDIGRSATVEHFYAKEYQGRQLFQELMDQDRVAHLVEFGHCGVYTANDLASVQGILNGIFTAEIAKRPGQSGGRSLMGVLTRVEPL